MSRWTKRRVMGTRWRWRLRHARYRVGQVKVGERRRRDKEAGDEAYALASTEQRRGKD